MSRLIGWIGAALAAVLFPAQGADACGPLPFDAYVSQTERALSAKTMPGAQRSNVARLIAQARNGNGPKCHSVGQRSLNEARRKLGLPAVKDAPIDVLAPSEQAIALRRLGGSTLADVDAVASEKDKDLLRRVEFDGRRVEILKLLGRQEWKDAITKGIQLQVDLGVAPPAKC